MRLVVGLLITSLLSTSVLLSGCVDCEQGPPVTARDITSGRDSGGSGGFTLHIQISEGDGGTPVQGAGVVVYWGNEDVTEWDGPIVQVSDEQVLVDPGTTPRTVEQTKTVRLFSDSDGKVTAKVPTNRVIGVVGAKDGYTEEWIAAMASGDRGDSASIEVPLYRQTLIMQQNGTWSPPGTVSSGVVTQQDDDAAWDPELLPFGSTPEAHRGYAARITFLTATISWENEALAFGNLGIALGPDSGDNPTFFESKDNNLGAGPQEETVTLDVQQLQDHSLLAAHTIYGGAGTDVGHFGPLGLDYTIVWTAEFDRELAELTSCQGGEADTGDGIGVSAPGAGTALVLVGLVAAAVVVSRRSP